MKNLSKFCERCCNFDNFQIQEKMLIEVFSDFLKVCFDLEKFQIQKVRNAE